MNSSPNFCHVGAPECDYRRRGTLTPITQTIDVWSLGCVFSVAATWVIFGFQGLRQFENLRRKAVKEASHLSQPSEKLETDYFHDGKTVLADVTSWHKVLRNALRRNDTITRRVLHLVDEKMLLGSAEGRIRAKELCAELKKITLAAEAEPREELFESIKGFLLELDDTAPFIPENSSSKTVIGGGLGSQNGQDRQTRKSKLRGLPLMKTAHRSVLDTHRDKVHGTNAVRQLPTGNGGSSQPQYGTSHPLPSSPTSSPLHSIQESPTQSRTPNLGNLQTRFHQGKKYKNHIPQTIAQARDEMKHQKTSSFERKKRDELLTEYFDHRDIVSG